MRKNFLLIAVLSLFLWGHAQNKALLFHGNQTDHVSITNETALNPTAAVTVEAWINASSWRNEIHEGTILGNEDNTSGSAGYILRTGDGGDIQFNLGMGSNWRDARTTNNPLNTGTWYHVAGVFDGATIKVYIDGVEVATTTQSGSISTSTKNLEIGRLAIYPERFFDGMIDEVRVWNVAIDEATLLAWKDIPVTASHPNEANLVAYYELNDDSDPTVAVAADKTDGSEGTYGTDGTVTGAEYVGYSLTCPQVSDLTATNITTTTADLAWTETGSATSWNVEYGTTGFAQSEGTMETGTSANPLSISGLSANTAYEFYVQSDCGSDDVSSWAGPFAFTTLVSCPAPTGLEVTDITQTTATLKWVSGGASNYNLVYGLSGFETTDATEILVDDTFFYATDLINSTNYEFYVQDFCAEGDLSTWTGPFSFNTACGDIESFPWIEGFEGLSTLPNCWTNDDEFWTIATGAHEGSKCIKTAYNNSGDAIIVSPNFILPAAHQISFWWKDNDISNWKTLSNDSTFFEISIDNGANWISLDTLSAASSMSSYQEETHDLTAYAGQFKFRFRDVTNASWNAYGTGIDDINISPIPTCFEPTVLNAENITINSADLSWTTGGATTWDISIGEVGFTPTEIPTDANITSIPYTASSFNSDTEYEFYVRDNCGVDDVSLWAGPYSFTTLISCHAPTVLALYDYTATTATFNWLTGGATNWNIEYGEEDFVMGAGTFMEIEDTIYTIEGLTAETTYEFYVQDSCGAGDESVWVGPISVTTTSTCPQPIEVTASPMDVSATISWNGLFATNWDIEWGVTGFTVTGDPTEDNIAASSFDLSTLTPETTYQYYVRADCGSDNVTVSAWAGPFTFTTTITPLSNPTECGVGFAETGGCIEIPILVSGVAITEVFREFHLINPHFYDADLNISLESPEGITVDLSSGNGSSGDNYGTSDGTCTEYTVFNMLGTDGSITNGSAPFVGSYIPEGNFMDFNTGADLNGVWTLHICDTYPSLDDGSFEFAELIFEEGSSENDILTFEFTEQTDIAVINDVDHSVEIYVDYGTDMTDITPSFTLSFGAQTDQNTTNFTNPVTYSVTAENNDVQDWTVTVLETAPATDNDFLTFSFAEETTTETIINTIDHTIAIEVGSGTPSAALVATFSISELATINVAGEAQVSGTTPNAFVYGTAFEYNVVAQNGDIQIWNVTVTEADIFSEALFLAYSLEHQASPAVIDNVAKTINIDIHPCVELTALVATFELSYNATTSVNDAAQESGVTANDFTLPVIDTVTAENGTSLGIYTITVNQLEEIVSDYPYTEDFEGNFLPYCWTKELPGGSTSNDITQSSTENHTEEGELSARFSSWSYNSSLNYNQYLITETFTIDPMYSEVSFWHRKSNSNAEELYFGIATANDTSWTTINLVEDEWNQAFADLSMYNGQDIFFIFHYNAGGSYYYAYIDDLTINESQNTEITVYNVPGQEGTTAIVSENDSIQVMMPFGTTWPITFAADFDLMSATTTVDGLAQVSTVNENTWVDNMTPVVYTVTAQDGSTKEWSVYVDVALNPAKEILTYAIAGEDADAVIDAVAAEIQVTMPMGTTDFSDLVATFTLSDDATVAIAGTAQVSAITENTWTTTPLVYTVTAQDGTTKDWSVFVAAALNFENEILTFEIPGQESITPIDPANPVIDIVMPAGTTDLSGLIATFTLSDGATANVGTNLQVSEATSNNWSTGTVLYDVAAENGTVKQWTINVSIAPFTGTAIESYTISGQDGVTTYIPESDSIYIKMLPTVQTITNRIATFELSEGATAKVDGVDQESGVTENDFTDSGITPVIYNVTAGDGTVRNWKVVVDITFGVNEIAESKDIQVYPNPNHGLFELAINIANLETVNLEVVNTQGQLVSTFNDINTNIAQSLDLSELAAGVYYIKVITENETLVKKVNILK